MKEKLKLFMISLIVLLIALCIVFVVNVNGNDMKSITENQQKLHEIANYARSSNFKNQTLIVNKLSEVWILLEEEKTPSNHRYSQLAQNITQHERDLIAKLTWLEARGESDEGQRAVIEVILNRVLSNRFPNSIKGVIFQNNPIQFQPASQIPSVNATTKEYNNVDYVLKGDGIITEANVCFFSTGLQSGRALYKKIGNHYFQYL